MLERFKRSDDDVATHDRGAVATAERPDGTVADRPTHRTRDGAATTAALDTARARQRDEFGGVNWGASFFGWLVAVGVATLLTSLLVAAGAAIGLTESDVTNNADEITLTGGIALLVVLMLAYYAGGYVAGRMSRFDGGRQGIATWAIGLIVTVALAAAAAILGDEYNVLEELNLPAVPVGDQALATGGLIAIAAILIGTLLAAMTGGKLGERYHKRVDRAGFVD
jgi:MFS family permease